MSRRRRRAAHRAVWHPDGTGIGSGGDCGGDIQRGDSYSVRFVRDDMPGSLVTVACYAAEKDEDSGEFFVQQEIEWMVCRDPADPGGTEIWSDLQYTDVPRTLTDDVESADREASRWAYMWGKFGAADMGWDGRPVWATR